MQVNLAHLSAPRSQLLVMLAACFTVSGCHPLPEQEHEFRALVATWIQPGTSASDAKSIVAAKGFKVYPSRGNPDIVGSQKSALYFLICDREWRIVVRTQQDKVSRVESYVFDTCI